MSLIEHAQRELDAINCAEPERSTLLATVAAFSIGGWSGASASWGMAVLERLLRFQPLSELSCHPDEWMHITDDDGTGRVLHQSRRNPEAFSRDGGISYYLLSEQERYTGNTTPPMHQSRPVCLAAKTFPAEDMDGAVEHLDLLEVCGADAPVHGITLRQTAEDGTETVVGRKPLCDEHYAALAEQGVPHA